MKFTVEQSALTDGVNWVSRSLSTRPIKTELLGIVINATGNEVFLSASDLETASKAHFAAEVKEPGKVLVPGKLLAEISRSLPNKPMGEHYHVDTKHALFSSVELRANNHRFIDSGHRLQSFG